MSAPLFFRIYKNNQIHIVKQFVNDERIVIGQGAGVQIDLQSNEVSAIHCLVEKRDDGYFLCDLGSEQGTFIDGRTVLDEAIASGDHFSVGPFTIYFMQGNQKNAELEQVDKNKTETDEKPPLNPTNAAEVLAAVKQMADKGTAPKDQVSKGADKGTAAKAPESKVPTPAAKNSQPPIPKHETKAAKPEVKAAAPKTGARILSTPKQPTSLKEIIKSGSGTRLEVIVSWRERIINTYHFTTPGERSLGNNHDINVPDGSAPIGWKILNFTGAQLEINATAHMKVEVLRDGESRVVTDGRFLLHESEVCFIELANGIQLAIRFAPRAPLILFDSPFVLGVSEFTGVLAALILAVITSLIVSVNKPKPEVVEEELERMAKVVFTKPPVMIEEKDVAEVEKPPDPVPEPPKKDPVIQKVNLADKKQETKDLGDNSQNKPAKDQSSSGSAAEVKPKDPKLKAKMFTSTKQGAAIKTGEKNAANMKSKEPDLKNTGLLAAFGSGGARNKLDKAYSGSGELLGAGEKATGTSGFNSNRAGDDLGSKAKDIGAGGAGTATQGIAGVGTQGRSTGMGGLGAGTGFGDKGKVQIAAGGSEEEFTGSIDKEAVRRVVKSALAQFKACYEREYRMNSKLEGKVVIQWEIHEQGVAKNAVVVRNKSTINNKAVEDCVRSRMMALKFPEPPPGTAAEVTYPFIFQGQKL